MTEILEPVLSLLRTQPHFLQGVCLVMGLLVGSFLNVVIHRLPKMMEREWHANCLDLQGQPVPEQPKYNLVVPRSTCPHCGHMIGALENIPVVSYLFLRGRCKACKASISARYPLVEAVSGALSLAVAVQYGYSHLTLFALIFVFALIALTFIDFDTQLLPDDITLPLLWLGLLLNLNNGFTDITSAVVGAMAGYLVLWAVYWLFKLVTGKEGMGYGDFKLLAAIGAWFGWQLLPAVILLSSVVGSVIGIALILFKGKTRQTAIPFGPFLALGGIAALFYGQALASFYLAP
ncbi:MULTISPECIES: A24 family peptidase [unclassified Methylophilus]|uniref:prepilin peptidase n=1 Tax=unclassified Methylophilus TaxID=2630143 RepID=UPI000700E78C|nr:MULTISPECIES: A24 family peptidase [unclassified Methylophilus]KQT43685.1 methyltransferase [Methylophilus sp. Leaf416]KQT59170.1 methyltransferase [Methylophilus sp. Leaf459]